MHQKCWDFIMNEFAILYEELFEWILHEPFENECLQHDEEWSTSFVEKLLDKRSWVLICFLWNQDLVKVAKQVSAFREVALPVLLLQTFKLLNDWLD